MQLRFYLIIRILRYYTKWNNDTAKSIWYSIFLTIINQLYIYSKQHYSETGNEFALKVYLKTLPYPLLTFLMGLSISIFGFSLRESERYWL